MATTKSYVKYNVTEATAALSIPFPFAGASHISVTTPAAWSGTWVVNTALLQVQFVPAVTTGEVLIRRNTPAELLHIFVNLARFNFRAVDDSFTRCLYWFQEARDAAELTDAAAVAADLAAVRADVGTIGGAVSTLEDVSERTLKLGVGSSASTVVPAAVAGKVLGWDASASALTNIALIADNVAATDIAGRWSTVQAFIQCLLSSIGSSLVGFIQAGTQAVLRTVQDRLRETFSVKDYGAVGDGVTDDTAAIQAALNAVRIGGGTLLFPQATYRLSGSLNLGDATAGYSRVILQGVGLPTLLSTNLSAPILTLSGESILVQGIRFEYVTQPSLEQVDAVGIRCYHVYFSKLDRLFFYKMFRAIDQAAGPGGGHPYNAFFSNSLRDINVMLFRDYAIKLVPYNGGNSGNVLSNIYINNRGGDTSSSNLPCSGGIWLQQSDDGVLQQVNIEWCKATGPLLVLNQCSSMSITGLHLEGNTPQTAYAPLIDIVGGNRCAVSFQGLTLTGNDWTAYAGVTGALFRMDSLGCRALVRSVHSRDNTAPGNMRLLMNAGSTCYGSTLDCTGVQDIDTSLSTGAYTPKVDVGTAVAGAEYPVVRWNTVSTSNGSILTDNGGGTLSATTTMVGTAVADSKGLWYASSSVFVAKQPGLYNCVVSIPTGTSPVVQLKRNYSTAATTAIATGGAVTGTPLYLNAGDSVQFVLASGSYIRTGVLFGITLLG